MPYRVSVFQKDRVLSFCLTMRFFKRIGLLSFSYLVITVSKVRIEFFHFALSWDLFQKKESSSYLSPYLVICFYKSMYQALTFLPYPVTFISKVRFSSFFFALLCVCFPKELSSIPFASPWDFFSKVRNQVLTFCLILWVF